ncbi:endo alpha-1,4 polygalactosaminidase [Hydrogenibacillus schlegelii]|nr:endo alpha-1,4 polygalactosaminidase [Hydrogenibacillus schlegelii]
MRDLLSQRRRLGGLAPGCRTLSPKVLGKNVADWPGERWVNIRRLDLLVSIWLDRFDLCLAKTFTASISTISTVIKTTPDFPSPQKFSEQAEALAPDFDWILVESCVLKGWCPLARPFRDAGKPVLALEDAELGATPEDAGGGVR